MNRIAKPLINLLTLTGESIDNSWQSALQHVHIPDEVVRKQQERLKCVYRGEKPDHIPFSADLMWWFAERWHDGTLEDDIRDIDLGRILGRKVGPPRPRMELEPVPHVEEEITWQGEPIQYVRGGYPGELRIVKLYTPVGILTAAEKYASRSFGVIEYPVKTVEDLKIVRYVYEQRAKYCIPSPCEAPKTPIQALLVEIAGVENTVYLLHDSPHEIEATMELIEDVELKIYKFLATSENHHVFACENLSADVSGSYFKKYLGPQLSRRTNLLHKHGKTFGIHMDGTLRPVFGQLQEVGVDLVNGITAAPAGDVEPEELRKTAGDNLIICDILPQIIFTPVFSDNDFERYVRRVIQYYHNDYRIIFGIGDMLPPDGLIQRVELTVKFLEDLTS